MMFVVGFERHDGDDEWNRLELGRTHRQRYRRLHHRRQRVLTAPLAAALHLQMHMTMATTTTVAGGGKYRIEDELSEGGGDVAAFHEVEGSVELEIAEEMTVVGQLL